jgi:hypothetical protein
MCVMATMLARQHYHTQAPSEKTTDLQVVPTDSDSSTCPVCPPQSHRQKTLSRLKRHCRPHPKPYTRIEPERIKNTCQDVPRPSACSLRVACRQSAKLKPRPRAPAVAELTPFVSLCPRLLGPSHCRVESDEKVSVCVCV